MRGGDYQFFVSFLRQKGGGREEKKRFVHSDLPIFLLPLIVYCPALRRTTPAFRAAFFSLLSELPALRALFFPHSPSHNLFVPFCSFCEIGCWDDRTRVSSLNNFCTAVAVHTRAKKREKRRPTSIITQHRPNVVKTCQTSKKQLDLD